MNNDFMVRLLASYASMIDLAADLDKALDIEYGCKHQELSEISEARTLLTEALANNLDKPKNPA